MTLETVAEYSTIVATIVTILGFPAILVQLQVAKRQGLDAMKLSGTQVLLAADSVLAAYQDISRRLRPGGEWHGSMEHPTDEELPLVEPYLGVFERLWIAYSVGQIDIVTIDHLYGYRLKNIWANPRIVATKLQNSHIRKGWSMLIALTYALEHGTRIAGHTDDWQPPEWVDWRNRKDDPSTQ